MGGMLVRQEPASVSTVRRELALELEMWGVPSDVIDDATLVLSEILGNAIRHCAPVDREDLDVSWVVLRDVVCITVEDRCDRLPILRNAAPDAPSGRGLAIVEALCSDWGFDRTARGKRVWARIAIP